MQPWEIEMVEKISEEEQRAYYEKVIKKYKEQIKELKREKASNNKSALASCTWRTGILAAAVAVFAGPAMMAFGEGAVKLAGEITSIASLGVFGGSLIGMIASDDNGPKDIIYGVEAARDAQRQIKEIKQKIKEIEEKPVMGKR